MRAQTITPALLTALLLASTGSQSLATTYYVNINSATSTVPYTTWNTAATNIQDAVNEASPNGTVLVADGVYNIASEITITQDIELRSVNGKEATFIDAGGHCRCFNLGGSTCFIGGFTLTNGHASGSWPANTGGGIYCTDSSPVVSNCVVAGNYAYYGGGMYSGAAYDCMFGGNSAGGNGGGMAGGTASNCTFNSNSAGWDGGGMSGDGLGGAGTASCCTFTSNSARGYGGGMHEGEANHCTFSDNSAVWRGGGMAGGTAYNCMFSGNSSDYYAGGIKGTAYNCTFSGNSASRDGGAMWYSTAYNCIAWYNTAGTGGNNLDNTPAYYSCSPDTTHGVDGNITNAPMFMNKDEGNHRLAFGSPCINAGANAHASSETDLDGNPRIMDGTVDMGTYESLFTAFDTDGDGILDAWEINYFGHPSNCVATVDSDLDGHNNLQESITGMDPTNAASVFMITNSMPLADDFLIEWPSVSGRIYNAFWSTNLTTNFQSMGSDIDYPQNSYTDTLHGAEDACFYKVEVQLK